MKTNIKGVIPPVITPLHEDGTIDHKSLKNVVDRLIEAGVDGLFALGSSAGSAFMTNKQRIDIVKSIVEYNRGRVPILMGEINMNALRCIEQINATFEALGGSEDIHGIVCAAPFYAISVPSNIDKHFRDIHASFPDIPLFAYDVPVSTHHNMPISMLIKLGIDDVLAGIKDSSGNDVGFRILMLENDKAGHPLQCFTGHEIVVDGCLLGGADGVVPGLANVFPEIYVNMYKASQEKNWEEVKKLQDRAAKLMMIALSARNVGGYSVGIGGFKTALKAMGIIETNNVLEPAVRIQGEDEKAILDILKNEGVL